MDSNTESVTIEPDTSELEAAFREVREYDPFDHKRYVPVRDRGIVPDRPRAGRWNNHLRAVLIPGKRKARRHPWADRLAAARTGGWSLDETHPGARVLTLSWVACGDKVNHNVTAGETKKERQAEAVFQTLVQLHAARQCVAAAVTA